MTKLIFVNRYFYPDHSATSQMLSDLAFELAKTGRFEIHIVTSRQRYDQPKSALPSEDEVDQVKIHRVWTSTFGRQKLLGRTFDYLSFYVTALLAMLKLADKNSIIIAKTDPPLISVVAAFAVRIKSARLVNWIQDLFPEVAAALGVRLVKGPTYGLLRWLRNRSLQRAVKNVAIAELMQEKLIREGIPPEKIAVIHNWADDEQLRPVPREANALRDEWGLQGKFVVGYSGNLGRGHDFDTILAAATTLRHQKEIAFLVIGGGAGLNKLVSEVQARGLDNIQFQPYQPKERLAESLSASDVHLVSLRTQLEGLIVPSKFYGIATVERPLLFIGSPKGQLANMIYGGGCGYVIAEGEGDELVSRILQLQADRSLAKVTGQAALELLKGRYSKAKALSQWHALFSACNKIDN